MFREISFQVKCTVHYVLCEMKLLDEIMIHCGEKNENEARSTCYMKNNKRSFVNCLQGSNLFTVLWLRKAPFKLYNKCVYQIYFYSVYCLVLGIT